MSNEQWQNVKKIFDAARRRAPEERAKFLAEVCGGDETLRREVESLLNSYDGAESFLETPAINGADDSTATKPLPLANGARLARYEIIEKIGAGGMGEIYLARDARLKREVALKILPAALGANKNYLLRFEQEACAASALNHPNILTVHEFGAENGTSFIATEFVKGKTLRERLGDGAPLDLTEILDTTLQVAAALGAAHAAGIVHRDIKPENIMIREADGLVKVLDFGLAKLISKKSEIAADAATRINTAPGMILGTADYMSPEQVRGRETDARTDIWSLGVVLYEMLAGRAPFRGETTSDKIARILTQPAAPLDEATPAELRRILEKALRKDRDERYKSVADLASDLKNFQRETETATLFAAPSGEAFDKRTRREFVGAENAARAENLDTKNRGAVKTAATNARQSHRVAWALCALLAAFAGVAVWKIVSQNQKTPATDLLASLRIKTLVSWDGEAGEGETQARFSPNGAMIAYALTKNGQRNVWTKQIPDGKPNQITDGRWNYYNPIWSPDGARLAFVSNRDGQTAIWTMPFSGGELAPVATLDSETVNLLHWSKNGATIYFQKGAYRQGYNLFALDLASKQITQLTNFEANVQAQFFSLAPDETRIAFSSGANDRMRIFVMPLAGGNPVQMTDDEASDQYPFWLPDGKRIIYSSERDGIFQTCLLYLDERRSEQINLGVNDSLIKDVSSDGGKILFDQSREEGDLWQARVDDRRETQITFDSGLEMWADVAPDGESLVFQTTTELKHLLTGSIALRSLGDNQQISVAADGFSPSFSPDGARLAFLRYADNRINLWTIGKNGADERQLTRDDVSFGGFSLMPYNRVQIKDYVWSPDSNSLFYAAKKDGRWNVFQIAADGAGAPQPITDNRDAGVRFACPLFAPDGERLAYTASGDGKTELFVLRGGKTETIFSSASIFKLIGWDKPGGNLILALTEEKSVAKPTAVKLLRLSADGKNRTEIASIEAAYFHNIRLAPDGRRIALAARDDGKDNLRVVSITNGENAKITANADPTAYISEIAWSPDGKAVYYGRQSRQRMILMIENFK